VTAARRLLAQLATGERAALEQLLEAEWIALHPDHPLVRLRATLDLRAFAAACEAYRHPDQGCAATYALETLLAACLLRAFYHESFRAAEQRLLSDRFARWFCARAPRDPTPDHSTLHRCEQWLQTNLPRHLHDELLRQIDTLRPALRAEGQLGDTFALRARAAAQPLLTLIRALARQLLAALGATDPPATTATQPAAGTAAAGLLDAAQRVALFGAAKERGMWRLSAAERAARLTPAAVAAAQLVARVQAQAVPLTPEAQVVWTRLAKVLTDEFTLTCDAAGQVASAARRPEGARGSYRLGSAVDPDATWRVHDEQADFGYNAGLLVGADSALVRAVRADTGATPDAQGLAPMLADQRAQHALAPPFVVYDRAAGDGARLAQVAAATNGQTRLVVQLRAYQQGPRFAPSDFTPLPDGRLHCPNGQIARGPYAAGKAGGHAKRGRTYYFTASQCHACPLLERCRGTAAEPTNRRTVFISDFLLPRLAALAFSRTPEFAELMALRPRVERVISCLVLHHAARDCPSYGLAAAAFHLVRCAVGYNLRQLLRLLHRGARPTPRPPPQPPPGPPDG